MFLNELSNKLNLDAIGKPLHGFAMNAAKVAKDTWALELTLTVLTDSLKLIDLNTKTENVTRPILKTISATCGMISTVRLFQTLHYAFGGDLVKDTTNLNVVSMITQASFAVGRVLGALHFAASLGFIDFDELAKKAYEIGGSKAKAAIDVIRGTELMHTMFAIGLLGYAYQCIDGINKGENLVSNSFGIVSFTTDAALLALGIVGATNPAMAAALGIVAGTTGLACFLTKQEAK